MELALEIRVERKDQREEKERHQTLVMQVSDQSDRLPNCVEKGESERGHRTRVTCTVGRNAHTIHLVQQ